MADKAAKAVTRDISPFLSIFRNFLLGRKHISALRHAPFLATRDPPPPILPEGDAHQLSKNHYCLRDGRREMEPPLIIVDKITGAQKMIAGPTPSSKDAAVAKQMKKPVTPGQLFKWD